MNKIFNEQALRADIVKTWGEHGAHIEVFDNILKCLSNSKYELDNQLSYKEIWDEACKEQREACEEECRDLLYESDDAETWPMQIGRCKLVECPY